MHKEAGRPLPRLSDDDVIDYMVMEAIAIKVHKEDEKAAKEQQRKQWRQQTGDLDKHR